MRLVANCGLEDPVATLGLAVGAEALGGTDALCVSTSLSQLLATLESVSVAGKTGGLEAQ